LLERIMEIFYVGVQALLFSREQHKIPGLGKCGVINDL
jgi:hypothetical protein